MKCKGPKRRRLKDNPYILLYEDNKYFVCFKDVNNILRKIEVNNKVFEVFNQYELIDLSYLNQYDRHIEHLELDDNSLYSRGVCKDNSVENIIEDKLTYERLYFAINKLSDIQKRRVKMFYFDNLTQREIAEIENTSIRAIQYTLQNAIEKISEYFDTLIKYYETKDDTKIKQWIYNNCIEDLKIKEYSGLGHIKYTVYKDYLISPSMISTPLKKSIGIGGITAFPGEFTNEKIMIANNPLSSIYTKIGDISEAYKILESKIKEYLPVSFADLCRVVCETVNEYFGGFDNISERMSYLKTQDDSINEEDYPTISSFQKTGAAMCVERAALSQNLLRRLNINSIYKAVPVEVNHRFEFHAFNLLEYNGKFYIYDSTIPTLREGKVSPLIVEIDEQTYRKLSMPLYDGGCSIRVTHFNPYRNMDYDIIYNVSHKGRADKIDNSDVYNLQ